MRLPRLVFALTFLLFAQCTPFKAEPGDSDASPPAKGDSGGADATTVGPDSPPPPLNCPNGGVLCGSNCLPMMDCSKCPGMPLLCRPLRTCFFSCETCTAGPAKPAQPIECFACDADQKNPVGTCEPDDPTAYCRNGDYQTAYRGQAGTHCNCNKADVANCPGAQHICSSAGGGDVCLTCGEAGTQDAPCKSGGTCEITASSARCSK